MKTWIRACCGAGLVLATAMMTTACASTDMTTFTNAELQGRTYNRVLVLVDSNDLALRRQIEERGVAELNAVGAQGVAAVEVLFPVTKYTNEEFAARLHEAGIEAVLFLSSSSSGYSSHYVPPTYHTDSTGTATAISSGSMTTAYGRSSSTTTVSGGYDVHTPWAQFRIELVDVTDGGVAWTAQGDSLGNGFNDQEDLWQSVIDESVDELRGSGLLSSKR